MSDTELGVNYHLRESGSGTESELGLTIGLCVKFKPLAQGNPFLLVTTIPRRLVHLYLNGIVTQTHVKCRLRCQNSQKKKKKNNYVCKLAGTQKTFIRFPSFPFFHFHLHFLFWGGESVRVCWSKGFFTSAGICFAFIFFLALFVCVCTLLPLRR